MTLFIPLGPESTWNHNELRIALRSWQKFHPIENVLIIGQKPEWLVNVHHVEFNDQQGRKIDNIFSKVKIAAGLYPEFIFANDDHFVIKPLTEIPYYYSTTLKDFNGRAGDTFYRYVQATTRLFPEGKYFDIHTPMICKSEVIKQMPHQKDVLFKSYYCNAAGIEGEQLDDCKINGHIRRDEIERYTKDRKFISTGESISVDLKKWLFEQFPEKSKYEAA